MTNDDRFRIEREYWSNFDLIFDEDQVDAETREEALFMKWMTRTDDRNFEEYTQKERDRRQREAEIRQEKQDRLVKDFPEHGSW